MRSLTQSEIREEAQCRLDFRLVVGTPEADRFGPLDMYFAALAAAQGHPSRALRLSGASEALAVSEVERWLRVSRLELGPKRSAAYCAEGRAMPRERAIEYALKS